MVNKVSSLINQQQQYYKRAPDRRRDYMGQYLLFVSHTAHAFYRLISEMSAVSLRQTILGLSCFQLW